VALQAGGLEWTVGAGFEQHFSHHLQFSPKLHDFNHLLEVLKTRLREFSERLARVERRVEETAAVMRSEMGRSGEEQRRAVQEMEAMEGEALRLRAELEGCEERRRQTMQSRAVTLDNLVEQMLSEAKKLELRVEGLRRGYQLENDKAQHN
jgi:uncharacterized protein YukE